MPKTLPDVIADVVRDGLTLSFAPGDSLFAPTISVAIGRYVNDRWNGVSIQLSAEMLRDEQGLADYITDRLHAFVAPTESRP
jgi:hypothetical protein